MRSKLHLLPSNLGDLKTDGAWASRGVSPPGLRLSWIDKPNPLSGVGQDNKEPCIQVSDMAGRICDTRNLSLVVALLELESKQRGAVRALLTGERTVDIEVYHDPAPSPCPKTALDDLELDL